MTNEQVSSKSVKSLSGDKRTKSHPKLVNSILRVPPFYFQKVFDSSKEPTRLLSHV